MTPTEPTFDRPLPASPDAERFVLGAVLRDSDQFPHVAGLLAASDFHVESHRRIFLRMGELYDRRERIDRVTVSEELHRCGQLESVGGIGGVLDLEAGMPANPNPESYARIVKEKSNLRSICLRAQETLDAAIAEDAPSHVIASAATEQFLGFSGAAEGARGFRGLKGFTDAYPGGLNALFGPGGQKRGVQTGFTKVDEATGGLRPGELILIGARPAMGKTALACNIADYVAVNGGIPVAISSLEMSEEQLWVRLACAHARVNQQKVRAGFLNQQEIRALQRASAELAQAPLFIDDTAHLTVLQLYNKLRQLKAEHGLGLAVVDYLQLMSSAGRSENRVQEVSAISRGLKIMAKELSVPVLALSQLSRACESRDDKRPQMADLRESGGLEQDADIVGFLYRPEVYEPNRADLRGQAELIIAKQRNGPTGRINLVFIKDYARFENYAGDVPEPDQNWQEPNEED